MAFKIIILLAFISSIQCSNLHNASCFQIRRFINGHNLRRQRLAQNMVPGQPPASEMKLMIWDDELAQKASDWASQFRKREHNPDRTIPSGRFRTGENLAWYEANYEPDVIEMAMDDWFNEYKYFKFGPLTIQQFQSSPEIGHYTQMAWSNTIYVGCALYKRTNGGTNYFNIVCDYGEAGNTIGQEPYKIGKPARRLVCLEEHCLNPYGNC